MKKLFFALTLIFFTFGAFAQKTNPKAELMNIAGEKVTVGEFMEVFNKNNVQNETIDKKSLEDYLDLYINFKLKVVEARMLKMDTVKNFVQELEGYRKQLAKPYFTDESVTESLLKEAYQRKLEDIRASHILLLLNKDAAPKDTLKVYERALAIRERALKGEDFGELAVATSEDPSARDREEIVGQQSFRPGNKGSLGYFSVFDMVYPFESGAYNTAVGEISMPVRSDFGYHLIKVEEKTPASGLIEAAHIYISVNPNASKQEEAELAEKADFIYKKILDGMRFEEAVDEYSDDKGSATRGGILSKFTVNRIVPEFVSTVKKMEPGQISAPVRTLYGYHIIKLISMQKPGSFEDESAKIKEKISKDSRSQMSEEAVINRIKTESKFTVSDNNLSAFIAKLDSSLIQGKFDATAVAKPGKSLFKLAKNNYTEHDFADFIVKKQALHLDMSVEAYARKLFNDYVKESCMNYEDRQLETKHPEFASLMQEYHDGILLFDLMDKKVWSKALQDTLGLKTFHQANASNYKWNERADVVIFTITNKDEVSKALEHIKQIDDLIELRKQFESDSIRSVRIQPAKFEKGDNKYVDNCNWEKGFYGPFEADADKATIFVSIRQILPSANKELDEARGLITSDYQNYLEKEWIKKLREKFPVKVNNKNFDNLKAQYVQ